MIDLGSAPLVVGDAAQLGPALLRYSEVGVRLLPPPDVISPTLIGELLGRVALLEARVDALETSRVSAQLQRLWLRLLTWVRSLSR